MNRTRDELVEELSSRWQRLSRFADLAEDHKRSKERTELEHPELTPATPTMLTLIAWADTHATQLDSIRRAQDAVAHDQSLDEQELREAVELARELDRALNEVGYFTGM